MTFFSKLNTILTTNDKKYLLYLFIFTIIIALIETLGVSIIMPFLSVSNDFSLVTTNTYFSYIYNLFSFTNEKRFVILFGILILFFYVFRVVANIIYMYSLRYFIDSRYNLIVNKLFKIYLSLSYRNYLQQNMSSLTKTIINEAANITELFWFALILISEVFVFLFIYSILFYINWQITLSISILIIITGLFIKIIISRRMTQYGLKREICQKTMYEVLNKSFNNIKMLKLQSRRNSEDEFKIASNEYTQTRIMTGFLQQLPRFIFEFIGFSIIIIIVLYHLINNNIADQNLLALISVFILGLYRILPSITKIFLSYNTILFQYKSLDIIYNDFNLPIENLGIKELKFNKKVHLKSISFSYAKENILADINLVINKNDKIAFIGKSGSGKSTLVDIIMGLHHLSNGYISIDNEKLSNENLNSWRDHFGYIPQSVYLFDGTISQNIAFGSEIQKERIIEVLKQASIWNFLKDKDGLNTKVGESGVLLSGGQKQRIAIARALYKNPDILVLDEATSALDDETEAKIMDEIYDIAKDKTLIIIAHRLSTIKKCNKIYRIENGEITNV